MRMTVEVVVASQPRCPGELDLAPSLGASLGHADPSLKPYAYAEGEGNCGRRIGPECSSDTYDMLGHLHHHVTETFNCLLIWFAAPTQAFRAYAVQDYLPHGLLPHHFDPSCLAHLGLLSLYRRIATR